MSNSNPTGDTFASYKATPYENKEQGAKNDAGKTRIELFPGDALFAISQVLTFGAQKYADRNWEKGISWGRVFGALQRHLWSWWQGKGPTNQSFLFGELDEETKMSHLWHAGCCLVFLISYEMRGQERFDDRSAYQEGMPTIQGTISPQPWQQRGLYTREELAAWARTAGPMDVNINKAKWQAWERGDQMDPVPLSVSIQSGADARPPNVPKPNRAR